MNSAEVTDGFETFESCNYNNFNISYLIDSAMVFDSAESIRLLYGDASIFIILKYASKA